MTHGDLEDMGWAGREAQLRQALLRWYAAQRRQLPWRGDAPPWSEKKAEHRSCQMNRATNQKLRDETNQLMRDGTVIFKHLRPRQAVIDLDDMPKECNERFAPSAYGVWVSEVMLQQTQVEDGGKEDRWLMEVVIPFWTRWMKRFPTLQSLASASAEEVNAHWAGLGFYGRAKRLHEGAKYVVAKHSGIVPSSVEELKLIPGIGPYTAGAIASIAFGQATPLVDGNVARVFSRLCGIALPAKSAQLLKLSWKLAEQLVDPGDPGAFNQALMELGATVCTPSSPSCDLCPLRSACKAREMFEAGQVPSVTHFPQKALQKKRRERTLAVAAVTDGNAADASWMLVRRPPSGLLAGQLDFPSVEITQGDDNPLKALDDAARDVALQRLGELMVKDFALDSITLLPFGVPLEHIFSHERHVMHIFRGIGRPRDCCREVLWLRVSEAQSVGITSGLQKVFGALGAQSSKRKRHGSQEQSPAECAEE